MAVISDISPLTRLIQESDVWLKDTLTNGVYYDTKGTQLGLYHTTAYSCLYRPISPPQNRSSELYHAVIKNRFSLMLSQHALVPLCVVWSER